MSSKFKLGRSTIERDAVSCLQRESLLWPQHELREAGKTLSKLRCEEAKKNVNLSSDGKGNK